MGKNQEKPRHHPSWELIFQDNSSKPVLPQLGSLRGQWVISVRVTVNRASSHTGLQTAHPGGKGTRKHGVDGVSKCSAAEDLSPFS